MDVDREDAARHDRRPAGDRPRLQDADRPRRRDRRRGADLPRRRADVLRLPGRRRADRDGRRRHARSTCSRRRSTGSSARAGRRSSSTRCPTFQNPAGVTMSLDAPRGGSSQHRRRARAARARGQPVRAAALRGRAAADALRARRRRVRHLPRHVLEDPLARPAARLGGRAAAGAARSSTSASRAPTCARRRSRSTSSPTYFAERRLARLLGSLRDALPRAGATSMLEALAEHFPREATWTRPEGGLFIWATLPDYIDTTDLLARALREHVAFVPGRAAYLDGRGGSSMRLNFSGVGEDDIREGVRADRQGRRASRSRLYSTLTGRRAARAPRARSRRPGRTTTGAPHRRRCGGAPAASDEPRRRPQGRAVARAPGVAALRRAGARTRSSGSATR